ncbi:MAG: peptidylprolyl isomerase [Oscillospiraceae bacterium]
MKKQRIISVLLAAAVAASLTACGNENDTSDGASDTSAETTTAAEPLEDAEILNFTPPEIGEEIAVITVKDYGEIKVKLFPDECPLAVENFKGLANMNYYDELIFHRVIPEFMIQGGDPKGNGTGGNSMWGGTFDGGVSDKLYHFTGAVAYANSSGVATNSSQFYIVNTDDDYVALGAEQDPETGEIKYYETFEEAGMNVPKNVQDMYYEKGGVAYLDGNYTVFGQVFEGMDVVRAISQVETDPSNDKPLKQVQMESVRIVEYTGE